MDINQFLLLIISFALAAMMWSYALAGDTYLFATAEAIFIGGIAANTAWAAARGFYSGTLVPVSNLNVYIILALIIGALAFTRLTRYRWAARYPTAVLSGAGVGLIVGLNLRTQILVGVTDTITGMFSSTQYLLTGTAPSGFSTAIGLFTMPSWALWILWLYSAVMMAVMVLTFSYTTTVAGRFFDPKSRWVWVSRLGRYFIMLMLGYIACQTLLGDSLDSLSTWVVVMVKRAADQISTGVYA
jgi:hypothetical protein